MARTLEVRTLWISEKVRAKVRDEHDLDPDQIRASVEGVGGLPFSWGKHPETGVNRALVFTEIDDEACLVVLYPAVGYPADTWRLGSAYRYP